MKALSIKQPWAWLIVNGFKAVENRDWYTSVRGDILIHTGKKMDNDGLAWVKSRFPDIQLPETFETGGIVGKARIVGCVHISDSKLLAEKDKDWFFGDYGFILDSVEPLPFMPVNGQLGFFKVDYKVGSND